MFATIGNILKAVLFLAQLWLERDKKKAEAKKVIADKITDAFKQTNKNKQASMLNAAIADINRLRG